MKTIRSLMLSAALTLALSHGSVAEEKAPASATPRARDQATSPTGYDAVGVVKQVDATAGKVTIAHEPIQGLNWPEMIMSFTVKDKALFDKLVVDRKVEFRVAKQGAAYVVTSVK